MFSKKSTGFIITLFTLFAMPQLFAQHSKLLYHLPLTNNQPNPLGEVSVIGGQFSSRGWTPTMGLDDQVRIELTNFLPAEGTLELTMSGLMPNVDNEWVPIALYSRGGGGFSKVDPSPGSYVFLKSDDNYAANGLDFKVFSAAFYGANEKTKRRDTPIYKRSWNLSTEYDVKIVWKRETKKFLIDDAVWGE